MIYTQKEIEDLVNTYKTPYKLGKPVLTGSGITGAFDECGVDIPFVFKHNKQYYMLYTGFDGKGYQTALATSSDLYNWKHFKVILRRNEGGSRWDDRNIAGTWIIKKNNHIYEVPTLQKVDGTYWLAYHAYPGSGYETGPAEIGLAWCKDEDLLTWHRLEKPIFSYKDGAPWEKGGLYKSCIIQANNQWYMFYNAKDQADRWVEQTGIAVSQDLFHWKRIQKEPVLPITQGAWDGRFVSDPNIVFDGKNWLNFYFGYDHGHAQEGLAVSKDLLRWQKYENPIITHGQKGEIDENHAHKAAMVYDHGTLYHFYCSTRPYQTGDKTQVLGEFRAITVAQSKPFKE